MAITVMRNRVTGEYKQVEADGSEFWKLRGELHLDGKPRWEQTGQHDLAARQAREASGMLRPEDLGDQDQPVQRSFGDPLADHQPGLDRGYPTPGEIEQGAGIAANMSEEELTKARASLGMDVEQEANLGGGLSRSHPDGSPADLSSSIGGSGVPVSDDTPRVGDLNGDGDLDDPYEGSSKEELAKEANDRDIEVVRLDGRTDLDPRIEDYLSALRKADAEEAEHETEDGGESTEGSTS